MNLLSFSARISLVIAIFAMILPGFVDAKDSELEDGDIIFQNSRSRQSQAIEAATNSPLTHVGIVFHENGVPIIYEAVQPVRKIPLSEWGKQGTDGKYVVRRLKDKSRIDMKKLKREVTAFMGKDYDALFGWCDSRIYCSELVWKAYERSSGVEIGDLKKLKQFDLSHPVVQKTLKSRYGRKIPFDMKVISPADLFASSLLFTVLVK